jgi:hypothetical protein
MSDRSFRITDDAIKGGIITKEQGELIKEVCRLIRIEVLIEGVSLLVRAEVLWFDKFSSGSVYKKRPIKKKR